MNAILRFGAPWSATLKVISAVVVCLLGGAAASVFLTPEVVGMRWIGVVLIPVGILSAALFSVRGYALVSGELRVRRLLWETCIPLGGLTRAEADARALQSSLRVFGNGGFFSFSGWYYNRRLGRYRMLVTDPARAVVLHFGDRRPLVVSPSDPARFVLAVMACSGRSAG